MSKLEALKKQHQKAVSRLDEILQKEKSDIVRDSAIKRFEFCFDLSWKLIKAFLAEEKGIICNSPKDCFRQAFKMDVIEYGNLWLQMTDWRNQAIHTYSEKLANAFYKKLPETLKRFQALREKIENY